MGTHRRNTLAGLKMNCAQKRMEEGGKCANATHPFHHRLQAASHSHLVRQVRLRWPQQVLPHNEIKKEEDFYGWSNLFVEATPHHHTPFHDLSSRAGPIL
jgi:hypothetical protein